MTYKIDEEVCISCGSCVSSCSQEAIIEKSSTYVISDDCIDCGSCVDVCPVEAISAE